MSFDISVIIPTYNRAPILKKCLEALDRQTFPANRFEVIVVDDGSTDNTTDVCLGPTHKYFLQYLHQENAGCGAARRAGVEVATGTYVLLINDDAILNSQAVNEHVEKHLRLNSPAAVLGWFNYDWGERKKRALTYYLSTHTLTMLSPQLISGIYSHCSMFCCSNISLSRQRLIDVGSFDARFRVMEDIELGQRILKKNTFQVVYDPYIIATHDHLTITIKDIMDRAAAYGKQLVMLYSKHPGIELKETVPFQHNPQAMIDFMAGYVLGSLGKIKKLYDLLSYWDMYDFRTMFDRTTRGQPATEYVMEDFERYLPTLYYHNLFQSFLDTAKEQNL